jgi:transcription termination factor Rho
MFALRRRAMAPRNMAGHSPVVALRHRADRSAIAHSTMHLSELKALHVSALIKMGEELEIENVARMRKQELMFAIMKKRAKGGEQVFGDGVLEVLPDGFGFLRSIDTSYMASTDDIYLSPSQIRRFNLHTGDMVEGEVRVPKDGERYFALVKVDSVNGLTPEESKHKIMFENLTPLFPKEQFSSNATSRPKRTSPAASST